MNGNRLADDFTVTDPSGWTVGTITFYAYQTGSGTDTSITGVNLRIWDGVPGPASTVVFGDTETNRFLDSAWSDIYRVTEETTGMNLDRPIMATRVTVDTFLDAGDYYLDWQVAGLSGSGPFASPIAITGMSTTGNALQYQPDTDLWDPAIDTGTTTRQGFPFVIEGPSSCLVSAIEPISPVHATKDGADVLLSWPVEPSSSGYNTWWVTEEKSGVLDARDTGPWPEVSGCLGSFATSCRHMDAVPRHDRNLLLPGSRRVRRRRSGRIAPPSRGPCFEAFAPRIGPGTRRVSR